MVSLDVSSLRLSAAHVMNLSMRDGVLMACAVGFSAAKAVTFMVLVEALVVWVVRAGAGVVVACRGESGPREASMVVGVGSVGGEGRLRRGMMVGAEIPVCGVFRLMQRTFFKRWLVCRCLREVVVRFLRVSYSVWEVWLH